MSRAQTIKYGAVIGGLHHCYALLSPQVQMITSSRYVYRSVDEYGAQTIKYGAAIGRLHHCYSLLSPQVQMITSSLYVYI